jgi:NifB/MoaA-like Fe-S oxidoreductase
MGETIFDLDETISDLDERHTSAIMTGAVANNYGLVAGRRHFDEFDGDVFLHGSKLQLNFNMPTCQR